MSYDITFFNTKNVNPDNIVRLTEEEADENSELFIGKEMRTRIIETITRLGLQFESGEENGDGSAWLDFRNFKLTFFSGQAVLSIPYLKENDSAEVADSAAIICEVLADLGFTGYDPQTEAFVTGKYNCRESFSKVFNEFQTQIDNSLENNKPGWIIYAAGLFIIALLFLLWKLIM